MELQDFMDYVLSCPSSTWAIKELSLDQESSVDDFNTFELINRDAIMIEIEELYLERYNWKLSNIDELTAADSALQLIGSPEDDRFEDGFFAWEFKAYGCSESVDLIFEGSSPAVLNDDNLSEPVQKITKTIIVNILEDPFA